MFADQSPLEAFDAIVIGAGISGLTTALIMAKEGKKVAIFERDGNIAPLIRPYKRKNCECSPGLHFSGWMGEEEAISSFFRYLGVDDGVDRILYRDTFIQIQLGSVRYSIPSGYERVEASLLSYFPESAETIRGYMRAVIDINDRTFYFNREAAPNFEAGVEFVGPINETLMDFLLRGKASQGLIDLLCTLNNILIGSKAEEVPFVTHAFVLGGFYRSPGCFTIQGINRLLTNFRRELERYGARIFVRSEVGEIIVDENRTVTGIATTQGQVYSAPCVVASVNPKLLNPMVGDHRLRPIYRRRLEEAENTFGLYVAFYSLETDDVMELSNYAFSDPVRDVTLMVAVNHSDGNNVLSVFLEDGGEPTPVDEGERKRLAETNLAVLEEVLYNQFPGFKGKTTLLDFLKPWSFERYTRTVNGSAYGIKQTVNSIGFQHKVPVHGLYMVGQAIYPGFLGAMISGFGLGCELFGAEKFWSRVINR